MVAKGKFTPGLHPHSHQTGKFVETLDTPSWLSKISDQLVEHATGKPPAKRAPAAAKKTAGAAKKAAPSKPAAAKLSAAAAAKVDAKAKADSLSKLTHGVWLEEMRRLDGPGRRRVLEAMPAVDLRRRDGEAGGDKKGLKAALVDRLLSHVDQPALAASVPSASGGKLSKLDAAKRMFGDWEKSDNPRAVFDKMTVGDLETLASHYGLPAGATKPVLIDRLVDHLGAAHRPTERAPAANKATPPGVAGDTGRALAGSVPTGSGASSISKLEAAKRMFGDWERSADPRGVLDKMTAADLGVLASHYGLAGSGTKPAVLDRLVAHLKSQRAAAGKNGPDLETKTRALQAENDHGRAAAEALAQVDELVHNEASDKALRHRIEHLPGTPEPLRKELLDASGDRSKLAQVADKAAKDAGLTPVGKAGQTVRYDRSLHEPMGGKHFPDGSSVVVARQGFRLRRSDGSEVTVSRPVVMEAGDEAPNTAPAKATKAAKKAAPAVPKTTPPSAGEVRQRLLALRNNDERRHYLVGLGLNQTQSNRLAKDLGARQTRISPDATLDNIVKHFDTGERSPTGPTSADQRTQARSAYQQVADRRPYANAGAELEELLAKKADNKTIAEHLRTLAAADHPDMQEAARGDNSDRIHTDLTKVADLFATGKANDGKAAMVALLKAQNLSSIGTAGRTTTYDPAVHKAIGTEPVAGTKVRVIRPGVKFARGRGDTVHLADALVTTDLGPTPAERAAARAKAAADKKAAKPTEPKLPPGVPTGAKKLAKAITGGPDLYEVEVPPRLYGVTTQQSGTAGFHTVHYNGQDLGDIKQAGDGQAWQVWQNKAGIEPGTRYDTMDAAAQAVAVAALPATSRWVLPKQSFHLYDSNGNKIGGWSQNVGYKSAFGANGEHINLGQYRSTKSAGVKAVLAHNEKQRQLAAARETAAKARRERLARSEVANANIATAQSVLYGHDPDAASPARQLEAYGALEREDFRRLDPGEQSAIYADLAYIATSGDADQASAARQTIDRLTPPGTPLGMVPRESGQAGFGPLNGTQDRFGTPRVGLNVLPEGRRGPSGDGWYTGSEGSTRWGQYGAAGVLLRHVDADGTERFLMVQRGPGVSDPGVWSFPGGAKDQNESFLQGGARELVEEMGLPEDALTSARVYGTHSNEAPDLKVPAPSGGTTTWKYVSIAADVDEMFHIDLTGEHTWETADARWLTRGEIDELDRHGKLHRPVAGGALQQNVMSLFPATHRAPAPKTQPARRAGVPIRPRPAVSDYTAEPDALEDLKQTVNDTKSAYAGKTADERLAAIGAAQGFDAPPTVVPIGQFDELLATGDYIEVWRGVQDAHEYDDHEDHEGQVKPAATIQEEFRSGPAFYGTGMYGNGYYFAEERHIAEGYADSGPGSLVRALIPRSAFIASNQDVIDDMQRLPQQQPFSGGSWEDADPIDGDQGRFVAATGQDGLRVDGYSARPIYVIVNRSALIVDETGYEKGITQIATTDVEPGMILQLPGVRTPVRGRVVSVRRGVAADTGEDVIIVTMSDGSEVYLSPTGTVGRVL